MRHNRRWFRILGCTAIGFAIPLTMAVAGGDCASARIEEPFVMPDGSAHAPGLLSVCRDTDFTPVTAMHRGYVDRRPVGLLFGPVGRNENAAAEEPFLVFVRDSDGIL